jgi:CRP/FNR family transcriptional regulator, cyclic AMP receptor protein
MTSAFDAAQFLKSAGIKGTIADYRRRQYIYRQGEPCLTVFYVESGMVQLSVVSKSGRQAIVAMLGPGEFFGEGCLAGQTLRMGSASAAETTTVMSIAKAQMAAVLHQEHPLSDRFIRHMLARNIRIEQDLIDHLFNPSEKRLARKLLLLARYGNDDLPTRAIPPISQSTLAEMVGTTRSRVNFFMKKFQRLGFVDYDDERIVVHNSLLTVVLHD